MATMTVHTALQKFSLTAAKKISHKPSQQLSCLQILSMWILTMPGNSLSQICMRITALSSIIRMVHLPSLQTIISTVKCISLMTSKMLMVALPILARLPRYYQAMMLPHCNRHSPPTLSLKIISNRGQVPMSYGQVGKTWIFRILTHHRKQK